jgi:type VI secretion system protein ImpJ
MFLCPQHLQALSREVAARIGQGESLGLPGAYGLLRLRVDDEALARDVFSILEGAALFKDGALAEFPLTAQVEPREFGTLFTAPELDVYLGIPAVTPNVPQIDEKGEGRARYDVRAQSVFDENLRDSTKDIEYRHLRARLFFGEEDRTGHECLPIARLVRRGKPVARSVLSATHVPTLLAIGASGVLMRQLKEVADLARKEARDIAAKIPSMSKMGSVEKGTDVAALLKLLAGNMKLQAVNQCVTGLEQLAGLPDLHPFDAYRWLAQAVGSLAIFGESRLVPELPAWDHAQQDACFQAVVGALRALLPAEVTPPYDTVAFKKDPVRQGFYQVELPPEWLERQPLMYLAVEVGKPAEAVVEAVGRGLKLLAPADVERVLSGVIPGIALGYDRVPPLAFPKRAELHYFRIQTEGASRDSWLRVLKAREAVLLSALAALGEVKFHLYVELRS